MGIEDVWVSVQNIFACKYILPTGIEFASVVVQIIPIGKIGYKYENICTLA